MSSMVFNKLTAIVVYITANMLQIAGLYGEYFNFAFVYSTKIIYYEQYT